MSGSCLRSLTLFSLLGLILRDEDTWIDNLNSSEISTDLIVSLGRVRAHQTAFAALLRMRLLRPGILGRHYYLKVQIFVVYLAALSVWLIIFYVHLSLISNRWILGLKPCMLGLLFDLHVQFRG